VRRKTALYAEREHSRREFFVSSPVPDRDGTVRARAVGNAGPAAVNPARGSVRAGSEGWIAFIVSQSAQAFPNIYLNNPGPDRIRRHKVGQIVIVTDFIGTGGRLIGMLNKLHRVPSVRAWISNGWISFAVVSAAGTREGIKNVKRHRTRPSVHVQYVVPTLGTYKDLKLSDEWSDLISRYGPREARGAGPRGYGNTGSLVVFSYRAPNNTPLLLHEPGRNWMPLFSGPADDEIRQAFGLPQLADRLRGASALTPSHDVLPDEERMLLLLTAIRGRWLPGQEIELAERTALTVPEILDSKERAMKLNLLSAKREAN
jgi:hypothetical protein